MNKTNVNPSPFLILFILFLFLIIVSCQSTSPERTDHRDEDEAIILPDYQKTLVFGKEFEIKSIEISNFKKDLILTYGQNGYRVQYLSGELYYQFSNEYFSIPPVLNRSGTMASWGDHEAIMVTDLQKDETKILLSKDAGYSPNSLVWSPDGHHLAFSSQQNTMKEKLFCLISLEEQIPNCTIVPDHLIGVNGYMLRDWKDDGQYILVAKQLNRNSELYLFDVNEVTFKALDLDNKDLSAVNSVGFLHGSDALLYSGRNDEELFSVYLFDLPKQSSVKISPDGVTVSSPALSPDGFYYLALMQRSQNPLAYDVLLFRTDETKSFPIAAIFEDTRLLISQWVRKE